MKEYKYTINGTKYEVAVGDIEENIVTVTVNGEEYKVEMEKEAEPEKKKPVLGKPAAPAAEGAEPATDKAAVNKKVEDTKAAVNQKAEETKAAAKQKANEAVDNAAKDVKKGLGL